MINNKKLSMIALCFMGLSMSLSSATFAAKTEQAQTVAFLDKQANIHWFVKNVADKKLITHRTLTSAQLKKALSTVPYPLEEVKAGGIGGNEKTGFIYYDGQTGAGHADALSIQRNPITKICYLQNNDIVVRDWNHELDVVEFPCEKPDPNHAGLYWYPNYDFVNGAYNPALDAFYAAQAAKHMVEYNFHTSVWKKQGTTKKLIIFIHAEKTYFNDGGFFSDGSEPWYVSLSDGDANTYPWSTLDIVSHFISVGTALSTWGYSWGVGNGPSIATSYSDMFAKAVEFDVTGKNTWTIGGDVRKGWGALRFMDKPSTDCGSFNKPGDACSLETYDDFKKHPYIEPEYGAGLLNKLFYLIATTPGWDAKKAFHLFQYAFSTYSFDKDWNPDSNEPPGDHLNFFDTFCNLITSARDLHYDQAQIDDLNKAIKQVGMDTNLCLELVTPVRS